MSRYYSSRPPTRRLIPNRSIHIHLLNLLDGFPYRVSPSNVITWALPQEFEGVEIEKMAMTASRLMMHVRSPPGSYRNIREWRMVVWDWETGDLVRGPRLLIAFFFSCCLPGVQPLEHG